MIIDLPWPHKDLSPNARPHWAEKARVTKKHRDWARWASQAYGPIEADKLLVTVIFFPPDNRQRDDDNMVSSVKAYRDGISDSLGVNDSKWTTTVQRGPKLRGGTVRFEIEVPEHG
jgi:crossover junction endodeoxyribonuclease RusA